MAILVAGAVLTIGWFSASPELHTEVHHDATDTNHACAITLASTGFCDTSATLPHFARHAAEIGKAHTGQTRLYLKAPGYQHPPANGPPALRS